MGVGQFSPDFNPDLSWDGASPDVRSLELLQGDKGGGRPGLVSQSFAKDHL